MFITPQTLTKSMIIVSNRPIWCTILKCDTLGQNGIFFYETYRKNIKQENSYEPTLLLPCNRTSNSANLVVQVLLKDLPRERFGILRFVNWRDPTGRLE